LPEAQGAGPAPTGWAALLPIGHEASLAARGWIPPWVARA
jgi:hypothetical protein